MKKRLFALFVCLCMIVSMLPTTAFAEAGVQDSNLITDKNILCEHHTQHDSACGYTEEECTCETFCTKDNINSNCPICSAEGAKPDKVCLGTAPMLAATSPLSVEHSGHSSWIGLTGQLTGILNSGNYVLTNNLSLIGNIQSGEDVTICLNGYNIYGNDNTINNLTICDCTGNGSISNAHILNCSLSDMSLSSCDIKGSTKIDGNSKIYDGCSIRDMSDMSINSGTTVTSGVTIDVNKGNLSFNGTNVQSVINVNGGSCNISGAAKIENFTEEGAPVVNVNSGECNITGGTILSPIVVNGGTCNITGGTITTTNNASTGEITGAVVVKGGSCNIGGNAQITGCRIDNGGAVSVLGGTCTISGSNINENNTKYGGVYVADGTCIIEENATVARNRAFYQGGGVYVAGGECDIHGTIRANYTTYENNGDGGGIYVAGGKCNIYGVVDSNTAVRNGGGVYVAGGKCNINHGYVNYNKAVDGGGIYAAGGECIIAADTIGGNEVTGNGGGIYVAPGAKVTVNTLNGTDLMNITTNTANGNGGGVYLCEGAEWDNLCDMEYNTAQYGGAIYSEGDCKLTIRKGNIKKNTATVEGGGLYLNDSQDKPCIVEIIDWRIKNNVNNTSQLNNFVSLNSKIIYEQESATQDTLPYDEPGSIILKDSASFTIIDGKYETSAISTCFDIPNNNKILVAGGFYNEDPSQEPTIDVIDGVKVIKLDGDIGYNQYDPNYPWAVYAVKYGVMSGTSNNPVYDGASIEKDGGFSLSGAADIQKFYYWYKTQGAQDSTYVAGLPSDVGDYTIKVGGLHLRTVGEEWYTECTFDLTITKADPSYTVPTGITASVGKPLSNVALPKGWTWKDGSTIPQNEGTQNYPAIFTPDDTHNYNIVECDIPVKVEHVHECVLVEEVPATCTETGNKEYWICESCGGLFSDENGTIPTTLEETIIPALGHKITKIDAKEATCTENGNTEYWTCTTCNKYFSDAEGKNEISLAQTVIDATGHHYKDGKCTVCGAIDPDFKVIIISGANGTWQKGSKDGLSFTSSAAYAHFQKVQVDGKDLDASNYTVKEGNTIVTLKASYLETLSVGKHTISIVSETGTADTSFTIKSAPASTSEEVKSSQTGDNSYITLWIALLFVSGAGLLGAVAYNRKHKYNR